MHYSQINQENKQNDQLNRILLKINKSLLKMSKKEVDSDYAIHSLISHSDLNMFMLAAYSFLKQIKNNPKFPGFFIHDDGSLTTSDKNIINLIPNAKILSSKYLDSANKKLFNNKIKLYRHRSISNLNRKLIDVYLINSKNKTKKTLILDSDVVFYDYPLDLISFLKKESKNTKMIYIEDYQSSYIVKNSLLKKIFNLNKLSSNVNSGLIAFDNKIITKKFILDYFTKIESVKHGIQLTYKFEEQTAYALLASTYNSKKLSKQYLISKKKNNSEKLIARHYVSTSRNHYLNDIEKIQKII